MARIDHDVCIERNFLQEAIYGSLLAFRINAYKKEKTCDPGTSFHPPLNVIHPVRLPESLSPDLMIC
jgi:hypothetical protein